MVQMDLFPLEILWDMYIDFLSANVQSVQ